MVRVGVRDRIMVRVTVRVRVRMMVRIKRVKTRHKQGQESNKGAKERGWGLQKGGNLFDK
jgi:hypothetical protein